MHVCRKLCDTDQMLANFVYHLSVIVLLQVFNSWVITMSAEQTSGIILVPVMYNYNQFIVILKSQ